MRGIYEAAIFVDPDVRAMSELIESERLAWGPGSGGAGYKFLLSTWEGHGGAASE